MWEIYWLHVYNCPQTPLCKLWNTCLHSANAYTVLKSFFSTPIYFSVGTMDSIFTVYLGFFFAFHKISESERISHFFDLKSSFHKKIQNISSAYSIICNLNEITKKQKFDHRGKYRMLTRNSSTKIVNFMSPWVLILTLGRGQNESKGVNAYNG